MTAQASGELLGLVMSRRDAIRAAVARNRGRGAALFGSAARAEDSQDSDIDLIVDFEDHSSLFDLFHLTEELEHILGRHVDVVSAGALKPRDEHIRREAIPL